MLKTVDRLPVHSHTGIYQQFIDRDRLSISVRRTARGAVKTETRHLSNFNSHRPGVKLVPPLPRVYALSLRCKLIS